MATRQANPSRTEHARAAHLPQTLGELRGNREYSETRLRTRSVKDELRENLIARLKTKEPIFPGIIGYEDTVVPQIVNAVLSQAELHSARTARAGEEPHSARADRTAGRAHAVCGGLRDP
jgi:hypothetical protein